jgi:hypothetical protein
VLLDLLADGVERSGAQEALRQSLILPEQTQQEVFSLNEGASELRSFEPAEEDHAPGFLGESFEHRTSSKAICNG